MYHCNYRYNKFSKFLLLKKMCLQLLLLWIYAFPLLSLQRKRGQRIALTESQEFNEPVLCIRTMLYWYNYISVLTFKKMPPNNRKRKWKISAMWVRKPNCSKARSSHPNSAVIVPRTAEQVCLRKMAEKPEKPQEDPKSTTNQAAVRSYYNGKKTLV